MCYMSHTPCYDYQIIILWFHAKFVSNILLPKVIVANFEELHFTTLTSLLHYAKLVFSAEPEQVRTISDFIARSVIANR